MNSPTNSASIRFNSAWDSSTWLMIGLVAACCVPQFFIADEVWPIIISFTILVIVFVILCSVYYKVEGNNLVVYQLFIPKYYPIDKIASIEPSTSMLSGPATSLKQRIAIRFTDRNVLRSAIPLIISPARRTAFVNQLLAVNPKIDVSKL